MPYNVAERQLIDDIDALEQAFAKRHGYAPENVSHWDPGEPYRAEIAPFVSPGDIGDLIGYIFSDEIQSAGDLTRELGVDAAAYSTVVTANGTTAICLLLHYLARPARAHVQFYGPVYFSAVHLARRLGIAYHVDPITWTERGGFSLAATVGSTDEVREGVVRVTNPIYGTGFRLTDADIALLGNLADTGRHAIVVDEAYATADQRIGPLLTAGQQRDVFCIYSPHKTVNVNGLKFAAVVAPVGLAGEIDQLTDVVCGGLTPSSRAAVRHFSSRSFGKLASRSRAFSDHARAQLRTLIPAGMDALSSIGSGPFVTVSDPKVSAQLGWDLALLERLAEETGATFIPTCRNWMSPATGLGFRVNLCRASHRFWQALGRLCLALEALGPVLQ